MEILNVAIKDDNHGHFGAFNQQSRQVFRNVLALEDRMEEAFSIWMQEILT